MKLLSHTPVIIWICNGYHTRLQCGRLWIRYLYWSNLTTTKLVFISSPLGTYGIKKQDQSIVGSEYIVLYVSNCISGIKVGVLASNAVDRGCEPQSGQTKVYKIGICCFSAKHRAFRRKSKDWLAPNQNNMSEQSDMSIRRLLFHWVSTVKIQLSVLV